MKKLIVFVMFLFLPLALGDRGHSALIPGTYNLLTLLGNGIWHETLSGAHGVPGNTIFAGGAGWSFSGVLQSVVPAANPWEYQSTYQITLAVTVPGPWGEAVQISGGSGLNLSRRDSSGSLAWEFTFTGADAENPSIPVIFSANFDGITPTPSDVFYYNNNQTIHYGSPLSKLEMTVVPIPATAWLLGTGLIGLVVIRRRMKK